MTYTYASAEHQTADGLLAPGSLPDRLARPGQLLRPAAVLTRARPVKLAAVAHQLEIGRRKGRALALIERHFPDELVRAGDGDSWYDTFRDFLDYVQEADWFPIDWQTFDYLWDWAMSAGIEEDGPMEPNGLELMADYLVAIPVRGYGLQDDEWGGPMETMPELGLIQMILGRYPPDIDFLVSLDIYDNWDDDLAENFTAVARQRLASPEIRNLPEPLCFLPDVAAVAMSETGNIILDTTNGIRDMEGLYDGHYYGTGWEWDDPADLAKLRQAWQEAEPVVEALEAYQAWCQGPGQWQEMAEVLLGTGGPVDWLAEEGEEECDCETFEDVPNVL